MEFIGLSTAVARIADCVRLDPHLDDSATAIGDISRAAADKFWQEKNPKIEWARNFGIAARMLNKALHDSNMPPQWMEFDNQKSFAVKNDAVKQEGIELLTHAKGWGNREQGNYSLHFFNAITQGEDALAMPIARGLNDGLAPDGKMLRFLNIGFDRAELVAFLDKNQIGHNLTPSPAPVPQDAPVGAVIASGGVVTDKAGPVPLTTGDIAFCFAGLRWKTELAWKKPLGDKPKWLSACVAIPGARGVSETRWNPVSIGAALVRDGHVQQHSVRAKFQTMDLLKPWLEAWKTYEADNFTA